MIEPNKISEIASKYGFNEYQINDLIDEMSKIHSDDEIERLKPVLDKIKKLGAELSKLLDQVQGLSTSVAERMETKDVKNVLHELEKGCHFELLPKTNEAKTESSSWLPDFSGRYFFSLKYGTKQRNTIELLTLAGFWTRKGKKLITVSRDHIFFSFAGELLWGDDLNGTNSDKAFDCFRNNIKMKFLEKGTNGS